MEILEIKEKLKQNHNTMETFSISPSLLFTGPSKKMTPTFENGGASVTLNSGSAVVGGELYGFPLIFLQVTHSLRTPFTSCLPFGTQSFDHNLANVALTQLWCTLS